MERWPIEDGQIKWFLERCVCPGLHYLIMPIEPLSQKMTVLSVVY
jgi:hypothetical protein